MNLASLSARFGSLAAPIRRIAPRLRRRGPALTLVALLLLGFALRAERARYRLPYEAHWDEPFLVHRALRMLASGDWNPHFFNYGSLTMYLQATIDVPVFVALAARPADDPAALRRPADVLYRGAGEDPLGNAPRFPNWQISHPEFLFWNRMLTVAFGVASIGCAFALGRRLAGATAGLVAAALLATNGFHVEQSAWATTDVPASALSLVAIYASLRFLERPGLRWWVGALAAAGLAAAVKYNAVVVLLVPLLALLAAARREPAAAGAWRWSLAALVPALAFLVTSPYAVLDPARFLADVGTMLRVYTSAPEPPFGVEPGLAHLGVIGEGLAARLGTATLLAALAGAGLLMARPAGRLVVAFALATVALTARSTIDFPRNLVVVYPLAAIAAAVALTRLREWAAALELPGRRRAARVVAAAAVALCAREALWSSGPEWRLGAGVDARSVAAASLDGLPPAGAPLRLAALLAFHPRDLARIRRPVEVTPLVSLLCSGRPGDLAVVPGGIRSNWEPARRLAEDLDRLLRTTPHDTLGQIAGAPLTLDGPIDSPGLEAWRLRGVGRAELCARIRREERALARGGPGRPRSAHPAVAPRRQRF